MSSDLLKTPANDAILRIEIDKSLRHPVMFLFTSGMVWLLIALLLGFITSIQTYVPTLFAGIGFLNYGRLFPAHMSALIYGWGFQAAFAAMIWLMARLSRQPSRNAGTLLTIAHVWNITIALGVVGILAGFGTGVQWLEMPKFTWPVLLICYIVMVAQTFVQFKLQARKEVFVSQWYMLAALILFPWIYITANTFIHCLGGHPLMVFAVSSWFKYTLMFLFFVPIALGFAYYIAPKITGASVYSYALAKLGFWVLMVIAPWTGLQKLSGVPIPYFIPYLSATATILLFIPMLTAAWNIIKTAQSSDEAMSHSPSLRFTLTGIVALLVVGVACVVMHIPNITLELSQFSLSNYGLELFVLYAVFSLVMFGAAYFIVPRVTCREWPSSKMIQLHYLTSLYGIVMILIFPVFGGLIQGLGQENFKEAWRSIADFAKPYQVGLTIAYIFLMLSNIIFMLHLLLMFFRLGKRSSHPTLLMATHGSSPHGPEGDLETV